ERGDVRVRVAGAVAGDDAVDDVDGAGGVGDAAADLGRIIAGQGGALQRGRAAATGGIVETAAGIGVVVGDGDIGQREVAAVEDAAARIAAVIAGDGAVGQRSGADIVETAGVAVETDLIARQGRIDDSQRAGIGDAAGGVIGRVAGHRGVDDVDGAGVVGDTAADLGRMVAGERGVRQRDGAAAASGVVDAAARVGVIVADRDVGEREVAAVVDAAAMTALVARDRRVGQRGGSKVVEAAAIAAGENRVIVGERAVDDRQRAGIGDAAAGVIGGIAGYRGIDQVQRVAGIDRDAAAVQRIAVGHGRVGDGHVGV